MSNRISILGGATCALLAAAAGAIDAQSIIRMGTTPRELIAEKVTVTDLRKSFDFYTKIIGLKEVEWPGLPKPKIDGFDEPFVEVCLNFSGSARDPLLCLLKQKGMTLSREQAKLVWVGFKTPDAQGALNRVRAAGFAVEGNIKRFMGLAVGFARDPDGYTIEFLEAAEQLKNEK